MRTATRGGAQQWCHWSLRTQINRSFKLFIGLSAGVWLAVTAAPSAAADYLEPSQVPDAPPGPGMGHVSISTEPGRFVVVRIIGRTDALNTVGPNANGCTVGNAAETQFVALDATGSGSVRLGPEEFDSMAIDGMCGTHGDLAPAGPGDREGNLNMLAYHAPECPTCSTRGWKIHFDGGAPIAGPQYPQPQPQQADAPQKDCAQSLEFDQLPPGTDAALDRLKLAPKGGYATWAYATCALIDAQGKDPLAQQGVFDGICKAAESAIDPIGLGYSKDFFCGTPAG